MRDTWYSLELPVLHAAVAAFERDLDAEFPDVSDLAKATGLAVEDVARAVTARPRGRRRQQRAQRPRR
jgi:hypothetical protein